MRFGFAAFAALALLAITPTQAKTIAYQFQGPGCTFGCSNIGVANGTPVNLTVYLPSSIAPGSDIDLNNSEFASPGYSVKIGNYHNSNTDDASLKGHLTADGGAIVSTTNLVNIPGYPFNPVDVGTKLLFSQSNSAANLPPGADTYTIFGVGDRGWSITKFECDPNCDVGTSRTITSDFVAYGYNATEIAKFGQVAEMPSIANIVRGAVTVNPVGTSMTAEFVPNFGLSLSQAAQIGGFDHFNWLQVSTDYPNILLSSANGGCGGFRLPVTTPFIDPISGGMGGIPADDLPYYWDEKPAGCANPGYALSDNEHDGVDGHTVIPNGDLHFEDTPENKSASADNPMKFITSLVGVRDDGSWQPLFTWNWESDYTGEDGVVGVSQNIDNGDGGTGGILDVQVLDDPLNVPDNVETLWVENGLRVETTDAPEPLTTSMFAAGLVGLMLRRRRKLV